MSIVKAIVNLLTLIATAIVNHLNRADYQRRTKDEGINVEKLHENPARHFADMFGSHSTDKLPDNNKEDASTKTSA